jgi:ornithine carbamoyltransferase
MTAPARRHFLEITDLSPAELDQVLDLSESADPPQVLAGQGAMLLFEKPSARTRTSMEMAVVQLGGHPVTLRNEEVGIDTRESAEDLARLFSRYGSVMAARVFEHSKLERLAAASSVPVINLLTDESHPIQILADLLTIRAEFGQLHDLTIAWVGDANNVARSMALGAMLVGANFRIAHPDGYGFSAKTSADLAKAGCTPFHAPDPLTAVAGADVVVTDAWYSMGQETEAVIRRADFAHHRVTDDVMAAAASHAIFLHCLPAHRGEEVTDAVLDGPRSRIWPEAENRMHSARGLMAFLLAEGHPGGAS